MGFMNADNLRQIFGQGTLFGNEPAPPPTDNQQRLLQLLAGIGSGMTGTQGNFAQQLGGGAAGMLEADSQYQAQQAQAQQMEMRQMQMEQLQREMAASEQMREATRRLIFGPDSSLPGGDAEGGAQSSPTDPRGQITATAMPPAEPYRLGALAERYESSGRGVGTVSTGMQGGGQRDPGGVSYGRYQIASDSGTMASFLQSPEGQAFSTRFDGLEPGSPAFTRAYEQLVADNPEALDEAQRKFLMRTHFQPVAEQAAQLGLPVDNPAIAEALFSQSLQHSGAGNVEILNNAMARVRPGASGEEIIDALYDARGEYARQFAGDSATVGRYARERRDVKRLYRESAQQGREVVARQSQQTAPRGLADRLDLDAQERALLAIMPPEQQLKFVTSKLGMDGTKAPDKLVVAETIASQTQRPVGDVLAEMEGVGDYAEGESLDQRDRKILQYQRLWPELSEQDVVKVVDGLATPEFNPVTGRIEGVDLIENAAFQMRVAPDQPPGQAERPKRTLFQVASEGNATGALSALQDYSGRVTGQFGYQTEGQREAAADRQLVTMASRDLVRALQNNPRYAEGERKAIESELGITPRVFESRELLLERLREMRNALERRLARSQRIANDPNLPADMVSAHALAAQDIQDFLLQLGTPDDIGGGGEDVFTPDVNASIDRWLE